MLAVEIWPFIEGIAKKFIADIESLGEEFGLKLVAEVEQAARDMITGEVGYLSTHPGDLHGAVDFAKTNLKRDCPQFLKFLETEACDILLESLVHGL